MQKDVSGLKASCRAKPYEFVVNDKWFGSEDGMFTISPNGSRFSALLEFDTRDYRRK
jgi:hypothetical protein